MPSKNDRPTYRKYLVNRNSFVVGYVIDTYQNRMDIEYWHFCDDGMLRAVGRAAALSFGLLSVFQQHYVNNNKLTKYIPRNPRRDPKENNPSHRDDFYERTQYVDGCKY